MWVYNPGKRLTSYGIHVPWIFRYPPRTRRMSGARSGWESIILTMSANREILESTLIDLVIQSVQGFRPLEFPSAFHNRIKRWCSDFWNREHSPFHMPVQRIYPSSISIIIHWPLRGYSYTGLNYVLRECSWRGRGGGKAYDSHVATRVVTGDVPPFCYMVIRTCIRTETWAWPRWRCLDGFLEKRSL